MKAVAYQRQLETSDAEFLDHLNLPGAPGKRVADLRAKGDEAGAVAAVAEYFRNRKTPRWAFYMHGTPWHETDAPGSVIRKADRLLTNGFINSWSPHQEFELAVDGSDEPDWKKGIAIASTSVGRATFVAELSTAFALTGNEAYATRANHLMRSFVKQLPFNLHEKFEEDHDTYFGGDANHTLTVAYRMFRMTDFLHSGAFHARRADGSRVLSDEDLFWWVKQLWFYAMQYARFVGDKMRRDNHHLVDHGHTPYVTGMAFPEFAISRELVAFGKKVILFHFGANLLKDGGYSEHSAEYQYHILYHFLHPLAVAQANNATLLSAGQVQKLRKWVEFSARAVKPDGWLPAIGDAGGRPVVHLLGALAGSVMTPELASVARSLGIAPGKNVNVSMFDAGRIGKKVGLSAYFLEGKQKGGKPKLKGAASKQYPVGGYTFFRSDWTPQADYMAVSHFPENILGGHAHWDPMSFLLHTRGETLIGDPAANLYEDKRFSGHGGESPDAPLGKRPERMYRGYSYSVNAHNCLVMNDDFLKNLEAMQHGTFWGGYPPVCHTGIFSAGGPIEVAEVWHDANSPTRLRRFVIHLPGIGFAFVDVVSAKSTKLSPMQYSQYFHFEGDVEILPEAPANGAPMLAHKGEASCLIVPGAEMETRWRSFRDEYCHDLYTVPATKGLPWVGELTRRIRGNGCFATFLLTRCGEGEGAIRYLGGKPSPFFDWHHEGIAANLLETGETGTVVLVGSPFGRKVESPEISTDAELAVAVLDAKGKVRSWGMARGSRLDIGGRRVHRGRVREWMCK